MNKQTKRVAVEVIKERERQDGLWGEQNHDPILWCAILGEEVGEVNKAGLNAFNSKTSNVLNYCLKGYREELIQVAAVAIAMIESFDRKEKIYEQETRTITEKA